MECSWTESAWVLKVLEELVVDETQSPIRRQRRGVICNVGNWRIHIESDLQFGRLIRVGNDCRRNDFDLWNQNLSRFDCAADVDDSETGTLEKQSLRCLRGLIQIPL